MRSAAVGVCCADGGKKPGSRNAEMLEIRPCKKSTRATRFAISGDNPAIIRSLRGQSCCVKRLCPLLNTAILAPELITVF